MADHRFHERESQRQDNNVAQPNDAQVNTPSVQKHITGREYAYNIFLREYGREEFRKRHGRLFIHSEHNNELMGEIYQSCPPEWREDWKRRAAEFNLDKRKVKEEKQRVSERKRNARHEQRSLHNKLLDEHRKGLKNRIEPQKQHMAMYTIISPKTTEDLEAITEANVKRAFGSLDHFFGCKTQSSAIPIFDEDYSHHLITVIPLFYGYNRKEVRCYPGELCVTKFNLASGVLESNSVFVEFKNSYWKEGNNDRKARKDFTEHLGIPETGPANALSPRDAFQWLYNQLTLNSSKRFFCDYNQFFFVYHGLRTLALAAGNWAMRAFGELIHDYLTPIQNYTAILLKKAPLLVQPNTQWNKEKVDHQFRFIDLIPQVKKNHICKYHENLPLMTRLRCARAYNARILHNFFWTLKCNYLKDFVYTSSHETCKIEHLGLGDFLVFADTLTLNEMEQLSRNANQEGESADNETDDDDDWEDHEAFQHMFGGQESSSSNQENRAARRPDRRGDSGRDPIEVNEQARTTDDIERKSDFFKFDEQSEYEQGPSRECVLNDRNSLMFLSRLSTPEVGYPLFKG